MLLHPGAKTKLQDVFMTSSETPTGQKSNMPGNARAFDIKIPRIF